MQLGKTANGHSAAAQASDKGLRVSFWVCICTKMRPLVMTCTRTSNRLSLNSWLRGRAPAVPTIAEQPQVSCSTNWSSNDLQTLAIARPSQPCYLLGALQMSFLSNFFTRSTSSQTALAVNPPRLTASPFHPRWTQTWPQQLAWAMEAGRTSQLKRWIRTASPPMTP